MYNGHGDVVALTDASGNVVATYDYDEWGNITNQTGNIDSPFTYAGQYEYVYDKETGLYFLKSRYYNAEIGRFTTRDRFKGFENRPASQNAYTYTENDPLNGYDIDGYAYSHWSSGGYEWYKTSYTFGWFDWVAAHASRFVISIFIGYIVSKLEKIPSIGRRFAQAAAYILGYLWSVPPLNSVVTLTYKRKFWTNIWYGRTVIVTPKGWTYDDTGWFKV